MNEKNLKLVYASENELYYYNTSSKFIICRLKSESKYHFQLSSLDHFINFLKKEFEKSENSIGNLTGFGFSLLNSENNIN